ncbi:MAG: hypothetical protein WCP17_02600 [bacterium]
MVVLGHTQTSSLEVRLKKLQDLWDKRVQDPLAFVPHEERERLSEEQARDANTQFGEFAMNFLKQVLRKFATSREQSRRIATEWFDEKFLVSVGYGRGYDSKGLVAAAAEAELVARVVDVSGVAYDWADADMYGQYEQVSKVDTRARMPLLSCGDILQILEDQDSYGFDSASVKIWYLSRVLNCLSSSDRAMEVLQKIGAALGRGSNGENRVVLVNAFRDYNPTRVGKTSLIFTIEMVLSSLRQGAGCPVETKSEASYQYFSQDYRAIEVGLK